VRCSEFKASVWAYSLGALEPAERAELERHLGEPVAHEGCQDELERAMRTAQALSAVAPAATPPAESWSKIEARIAGQQRPSGRRVRRPAWLPWAVSFVAAAACALLLVKVWTDRRALIARNAEISGLRRAAEERDACRQELEAMRKGSQAERAALALLELPTTQLVPLFATPNSKSTSHGTALLNMEERRAVVLISALSPAVGRDYELWVIRSGTPVPAGILKPGEDGKAVAEIDRSLLQSGRPDTFAVTVEPTGGSPTPTTDPFLSGSVKG
jgi:anti-sigma-K factor RskA